MCKRFLAHLVMSHYMLAGYSRFYLPDCLSLFFRAVTVRRPTRNDVPSFLFVCFHTLSILCIAFLGSDMLRCCYSIPDGGSRLIVWEKCDNPPGIRDSLRGR